MLKFSLLPLLLLGAALAVPANSVVVNDVRDAEAAISAAAPRFVPGQLIVKFRSVAAAGLPAGCSLASASDLSPTSASLRALNTKSRLKRLESLGRGFEEVCRLEFDSSADIRALARRYAGNPDVEYAEPDYLVKATAMVPNDPRFIEQWGHQAIGSAYAWDLQAGSADVVIAIIDTGTDYTHEDLAANMWTNTDEIPDNGIDDDGNGYVDDVRGWDFVGAGDNDPADDYGHGTHTAGIAAAVGNNAVGVAGMSWHSRIMPVKSLNSSGEGDDFGAARAIHYAADNGADILSNSWGGYGESELVREAVDYAFKRGCTVVASAGNDGGDIRIWPGSLENVIAVGATMMSSAGGEKRADFSNYGRWVDVLAPGDYVASTLPGNNYSLESGTSMSAPFVSGLCALVASQHPEWSNRAVMGQVVSTADSLSAQEPEMWSQGLLGSGRINAYAALTAPRGTRVVYVGHAVVDPLGDNDGMIDPGETFDLRIRLKNTWAAVSGVSVHVSSPSPFVHVLSGDVDCGTIGEWEEKDSTTAATFQATADCPPDYALPFDITICSDNGYVRTDSFNVYSLYSPWRCEGLDTIPPCFE